MLGLAVSVGAKLAQQVGQRAALLERQVKKPLCCSQAQQGIDVALTHPGRVRAVGAGCLVFGSS